jgi:hypothetical protein
MPLILRLARQPRPEISSGVTSKAAFASAQACSADATEV